MQDLTPPPAAPPPPVAPTAVLEPPAAPLRRLRPFGALLAGAGLAAVAFAGESGNQLGRATAVELALVLLAGVVAAWAVLTAPAGARLSGPGAVAVALFFALVALTAVSIGWAVQPADAWVEANRTLAYAAAFTAAGLVGWLRPDRASTLAGAILVATAAVCAWALLTRVLPGELDPDELVARLREPYGYWNAVGLTGALAFPAALWLGTRRTGSPLVSALAFPALAVAVAVVLLAYSRGSIVAAAIACAVWFALSDRRLRAVLVLVVGGGAGVLAALWSFGQDALSEDRVALAAREAAGQELGVLLVALLLLTYAAGLAALFAADARPLRERVRRRTGIALLVGLALLPVAAAGLLTTADRGLGGSLDSAWTNLTDPDAGAPTNDPQRLTGVANLRARYWDDALRMWSDHKLRGVGAGGFATARTRYREDRLEVQQAHGYVVQTLADLGLAGLLVSLGLLAAWLVAARRALRWAASGPRRAALVALAAVAAGFGAHSLIDWTWFVPGTAVLGLVAAGLVAGAAAPARGVAAPLRARLRDPRRLAVAALALVAALAAAWVVAQPQRSRDAGDAALRAADARRFAEARGHAATARDRNPVSVEPLFVLAAVEQAAGRKDAAERALQQAVRLQPANPEPWRRLAEYQLRQLDRPEDAARSVRSAIYLDPRSFALTQLYLDATRER